MARPIGRPKRSKMMAAKCLTAHELLDAAGRLRELGTMTLLAEKVHEIIQSVNPEDPEGMKHAKEWAKLAVTICQQAIVTEQAVFGGEDDDALGEGLSPASQLKLLSYLEQLQAEDASNAEMTLDQAKVKLIGGPQ